MASSSYTPYVQYPYTYTYPYPSNISPANFTSVKLSGRDNYGMWKTQMLCLLRSHGMFSFTDETPLINHQTGAYGQQIVGDHHWLWLISNDTVVKGWILGSVSEEPLRYVLNRLTEKQDQRIERNRRDQRTDAYFSAIDIWDELKTIYGPPDKHEEEEKTGYDARTELYEAIIKGDWEEVEMHLTKDEDKVTVVEKVANNGNTALHVAVGNTKDHDEFIKKLLSSIPKNTKLSDVRNSDGSTILHIAAMAGDVNVTEMLLEERETAITGAVDVAEISEKREVLLFLPDNKRRLPLAIALLNMDDKMSMFLRERMKGYDYWNIMLSTDYGDELLVILISSKKFGEAYEWLKPLRKEKFYSNVVLMSIAQNFPSELNALEKYTVFYVKRTDRIRWSLQNFLKTASHYIVCGSWMQRMFNLVNTGIEWMIMNFLLIPKMLVWPFITKRLRTHVDAIELLRIVCDTIHDLRQPIPRHLYYTDPLFEATRQNTYEVTRKIVENFPKAIWSANEDGHNIIQCAVIHRSEKVYNVVYQMKKHKNNYRTILDSSHNNLLHLVARLAPMHKLNLISGAALQVQRELQWYKEVESFVSPLCINQKNSFGETPQMVFTREHKDLVIEGEKWIKAAAESYTITAALITTIVFAAAITVPGGNNQDSGRPIFTKNTAFTIFAISDAISFFTAVTSLLIFLSILTTRFAQEDFLHKLPRNLIFGLTTLFISTTAMIVAFGSTFYIVFGQRNSRILIPIVVLTSVPITFFAFLQFSLIKDLIIATYGRSIFGKKRDESFY